MTDRRAAGAAADEQPAPGRGLPPALSESRAAYADLRRAIVRAGLLRPQPAAAVARIAGALVLLALGIVVLALTHTVWLRLLDAAFLAVVFGQIGFIGHDAGHRQIARDGWKRTVVSLVHGNLLLGVSAGWWVDKHNRHHSYPNQDGRDPDVHIPVLAFSAEQARRMTGPGRIVARFQAYLLVPLLLVEAFSLHEESVHFLLRRPQPYRAAELALLLLHGAWYGGMLVALLGLWQALLFAAVHQALFGLYLGSVFAPNHKGMPMLARESDLDFLTQQVLTARNVHGNRFVDWWYGGLNYQIEHHLFPAMPRSSLKRARPIVRAFCAARGLPYNETGMLRSYGEILRAMHAAAAPLRRPRERG